MKICIIGAGPSGITAAKNLKDKGFDIRVFDYGSEVGGNWVFNEETGHSSVFETTHIISSKTLSEYEDFPFPEGTPDYPSHKHLAAYFQAYAREFDLYPYIQFRTLVKSCKLNADKIWEIVTEKDGITTSGFYENLVVCNGHHWLPRMPTYKGEFTGEFIHSHEVKRFARFKDKKVLVIGGGNSACDVAVESSRVAQTVSLSWRRGYWIAPKFIMGKPVDTIGGSLNILPTSIWAKSIEFMLKLRNGVNSQHGLPNPKTGFGSHHPTINEDLFYTIRHGKIKPRTEIDFLNGKEVVFKDGSREEFDIIVACTGYIISHPFFEKSFIDYSEGEVPLWLKMFHPEIKNLYFIGLFQPLGCIWPGSELQAKLMAKELAGQWKRPENIKKKIEEELKNPDFKQINTPRHTITVHFHKFRERLKKQLAI